MFGVRREIMAQRAQPALATTDVFQKGDIHWKQFNVETSTASSSPPKPLLIFTPTVPGLYPVILFCHGFCIRTSYYSKLLAHIVSHGFILVAPQLVYLVLLTLSNFSSSSICAPLVLYTTLFNNLKP